MDGIIQTRKVELACFICRAIFNAELTQMPKNPKIAALLCGAVAAWQIYNVATATESPSTALAVLQYVIIAAALVGLVGALKQMLDRSEHSN